MPATLQIIPESGDPFDVRIGNHASIGRLPDSTVCLPSDTGISRQHAVIRSHNGFHYQIIDLGSLNGTYVNGHRVVLPARLDNGARILIADNEIVFEQSEESSAEFQRTTIGAGREGANDDSIFAALMVCDIRGFTKATEAYSQNDLAQTLGGWFRLAGNLIQENGGNIDKFMGDAVFAYWTKGKAVECQAALETGQELLRLALTMNWPDASRPFEIVVALNCGEVTCGNIGIIAERGTTIMGNAVNTLFRLESVAKELNQRLVASQDFVLALPSADGFADLGEHSLKGKRHPVRVFGFQ